MSKIHWGKRRLDELDIRALRHRAEADFPSWLPLVEEVEMLRAEQRAVEEVLEDDEHGLQCHSHYDRRACTCWHSKVSKIVGYGVAPEPIPLSPQPCNRVDRWCPSHGSAFDPQDANCDRWMDAAISGIALCYCGRKADQSHTDQCRWQHLYLGAADR